MENFCLGTVVINGELYVYNMLLEYSYRKYIPIISLTHNDKVIQNIPSIIDTNNTILTCLIDGVKREIDFSKDLDIDLFRKTLTSENCNPFTSEKLDSTDVLDEVVSNKHLDFAVSAIKSHLLLLSRYTHCNDNLFMSMYKSFDETNSSLFNPNKSINISLLISAFLLLDNEIKNMPNELCLAIEKELSATLSSINLTTNTAIIEDGKINYKLLINQIRNSVAHSNYDISNENTVHFYNYGGHKNSLNFDIELELDELKKIVEYIFSVNNFYSTSGFIQPSSMLRPLCNQEDILEYLDMIHTYEIKKKSNGVSGIYTSLFQLNNNIKELRAKIINNKKSNIPTSSSEIELVLLEKNRLSLLNQIYAGNNRKLTDKEKEQIIKGINSIGKDYFFSLDYEAQVKVIDKIIKSNRKNNINYVENSLELVSYNHFLHEYYGKNPENYIDYSDNIKMYILSFLNILLLYCYNKNKAQIEVNDLEFDEQIYNDFINSKNNKIKTLALEIANAHNYLDADYNTIINNTDQFKYKGKFKTILEVLAQLSKFNRNAIANTRKQIDSINKILNGTATSKEKKDIKLEILNRFRDSIAHGRVNIILNQDNILESILEIEDTYEGIEQLKTKIKLGDLIKLLNKYSYINSITNENIHFSTGR